MGEREVPACGGCGTRLDALAVAGRLCPACLLRSALDEEPEPLDGEIDPALELPIVTRPATTTILSILGGDPFHTRYLGEREPERQLVTVAVWRRLPGLEWAPGLFDARARALADLVHPGVARLLEAGLTTAGEYGVVSEFAQGLSVARYCAVMASSLEQREIILSAAGHAISAMHAAGIAHGRLSSRSIVVHGDPAAPRVRLVGPALAVPAGGGTGADWAAFQGVAEALRAQNR